MTTCGCTNETFKKIVRILNILAAFFISAIGILRFILSNETGESKVIDYALSVYFMY